MAVFVFVTYSVCTSVIVVGSPFSDRYLIAADSAVFTLTKSALIFVANNNKKRKNIFFFITMIIY